MALWDSLSEMFFGGRDAAPYRLEIALRHLSVTRLTALRRILIEECRDYSGFDDLFASLTGVMEGIRSGMNASAKVHEPDWSALFEDLSASAESHVFCGDDSSPLSASISYCAIGEVRYWGFGCADGLRDAVAYAALSWRRARKGTVGHFLKLESAEFSRTLGNSAGVDLS